LTGTLYVVATPIGNLGDMGERAVATLKAVALIACEDTRTTRTLLARHGIATRSVALHAHNERAAAGKLIELLREGQDVALVSDAGTPALSDPGAAFVAEAHRAGIPVRPIPGPSAAAAAFSVAGFPAGGFFFAGFLPLGGAARKKALAGLDIAWPVVLYEAPHRIRETLTELAERLGAEREIVICRELTKKFEEVARLPLGDAGRWLQAPHRAQGEFVLVLAPGVDKPAQSVDADSVLEVLLDALAPSEAAKLAARITGLGKNELYRRALKASK
jgi:16S rRNA (cytidine1402-2'-O)-methyltransferase